jgi:hypothetical protein
MSIRPVLPVTDLPPDSLAERTRFNVERELTQIKGKQRLAYEDRLSGNYSALAPPTGGIYVAGDRVRNSAPAELGVAGSMYVIVGWICTATGNPGTWVEMRVLTGA